VFLQQGASRSKFGASNLADFAFLADGRLTEEKELSLLSKHLKQLEVADDDVLAKPQQFRIQW
jgi:hypothetical protein